MKYFDAAVIGGGILGCFAARNLRKWNISTVLLEAAEDVCTGVSKANTAIVYAGYDNQAGSLKAEMTVRGNASFDALCRELGVPFSRCGSLMVSAGPGADRVLQKKYDQGMKNGVPGLQLISGAQARDMEPMLSQDISSALYAPGSGTVNPWSLGIAACENAQQNGAEVMLNTRVQAIERTAGGYLLETNHTAIECRIVINCAGLQADRIQELLFPPSIRLFPDGADFLVLDKGTAKPKHIIFQECEARGKGVTAVPTVDGNLLLGPSQRPLNGKPWATSVTGMDFLKEAAAQVLPAVDLSKIIRSFASVRPNPHRVVWKDGQYVADGKSIGSFVIDNPGPGFFSLIGIKTPGLTCCDELGRYVAGKCADYLDAAENTAFDPRRSGITCKDHEIVCLCEQITKAEIREAIARGATTVDGVKRRVGSGMGRCQGSRCTNAIEKILEECSNGTL